MATGLSSRLWIYLYFCHHVGSLTCNTYLFVRAVKLCLSAATGASLSVREMLRIAGAPVLTAFPNQDFGTCRLLHFGERSEKEQGPDKLQNISEDVESECIQNGPRRARACQYSI